MITARRSDGAALAGGMARGLALAAALIGAGCTTGEAPVAAADPVPAQIQPEGPIAPQNGPVNPVLWRATVDSMGFLPMRVFDPAHGAFESDWYSPPDSPHERYRVSIAVGGPALIPSNLQVTVVRQLHSSAASWFDVPVGASIPQNVRSTIFQRARELSATG